MIKIKFFVLTLSLLSHIYACKNLNSSKFYIKARYTEELKMHAFERCGRKYKVIKYEDDTALIICLGKNG